jgi:DnaK suppressor protein
MAEQQDAVDSLIGTARDLDDVEAALRKLDEGTHGKCDVCHEPIGEDRLASSPAARYCGAHGGA